MVGRSELVAWLDRSECKHASRMIQTVLMPAARGLHRTQTCLRTMRRHRRHLLAISRCIGGTVS